ncbi:MAG: hypothetical protein E7124_07010 [Bacteroidales bacterium]|nr:hypothetical protein [Bacteroidales bacterium]
MKRFLLLFISSVYILAGCEKEEAYGLEGSWREDNYDGTFINYNFKDGKGQFLKFVLDDPDDINGSASSDYIKPFTYIYNEPDLIIDYGFGYIERFTVQSITAKYLTMYFSDDAMNLSRRDVGGWDNFRDYSMSIRGRWEIVDYEFDQKYDIIFRADGTYESKGYSALYMYTPDVLESGTYEVQSSRLKFSALTDVSLLDDRVFMLTFIGTSKIHLETENQTAILGNKK